MTDKVNPYLSTKEGNAIWYRLDPISFPYMNPDLTEEEEEEEEGLDLIIRFFGWEKIYE
jgi:hypothetical protein